METKNYSRCNGCETMDRGVCPDHCQYKSGVKEHRKPESNFRWNKRTGDLQLLGPTDTGPVDIEPVDVSKPESRGVPKWDKRSGTVQFLGGE